MILSNCYDSLYNSLLCRCPLCLLQLAWSMSHLVAWIATSAAQTFCIGSTGCCIGRMGQSHPLHRAATSAARSYHIRCMGLPHPLHRATTPVAWGCHICCTGLPHLLHGPATSVAQGCHICCIELPHWFGTPYNLVHRQRPHSGTKDCFLVARIHD